MADKQASVYIVDVGSSMGEMGQGRDGTDLEFAMKWVWDKITSTVMTERKTDVIGVVGLRTDETDNELGDDPSYQNISVLAEIRQFLMPQLRALHENVNPSNTEMGDGISALVIAIQMITKYTRKLKFIRNIYLVTNARGSFDPDGLDEIAKQMVNEGIKLTVLGVDFDDQDYGFKEEDKDELKAENEKILRELCKKTDGVFGTLAEAVAELGRPRLKKIRPVTSYRGTLTLGDYTKDDTAMNIDVERYPRTMIARPMTASSYVQKSKREDTGEGPSTRIVPKSEREVDLEMTSVRMERTYLVDDEDVPGGKREVNRDELDKGYMYGRAVVPISQTDEGITILETNASFEILGFVPRTSYERYFSMSTTCVVVGQKGNPKAAMALSSLIHAIYELDNYILARLVTKDNKPPLMLVMAPSIEPDFEALIDVQVPFLEDIRQYCFPPLDTVKTITGKVLDKHRNLPTDEMAEAMGEFIDKMDLSTLGRDDDGEPADWVPPEDTFSPVLHRIDQVVRWRAIHPNEPIPPPYDILLKYSHPPKELIEKSQTALDKLIKASNVKKVPPKVRGKREREQPKPLSGLNVDELLKGEGRANKKVKISPQNAIPEFKQSLATVDMDIVKESCHQMAELIKKTITDSFADTLYDKALELIRTMREELADLDEPELYNEFAKDLKKELLEGYLGGNRKDMWKAIRKNRLGLLTTDESERSTVTEDEAKSFLLDS